MKNKKIGTLITIALTLGLILVYKLNQNPSNQTTTNNFNHPPIFGGHQKEGAQPDVSGTTLQVNDEDQQKLISPEFQSWVSHESGNLETPVKDPQKKENELRQKANLLSPAERSYLARQAVNMEVKANQRIFSTYLLTLADRSSENLIQITQSPLKNDPRPQIHSPEETLLAQEKALRRMALDELVERVESKKIPMEILALAISQISDESLRRYAEKRLQDLK